MYVEVGAPPVSRPVRSTINLSQPVKPDSEDGDDSANDKTPSVDDDTLNAALAEIIAHFQDTGAQALTAGFAVSVSLLSSVY